MSPSISQVAIIDPAMVGSHVTIGGTFSNTVPPIALLVESPPVIFPPVPLPFDFQKTLLEIPLTSEEEATVEALLTTFAQAAFLNPDRDLASRIEDAFIQGQIDPMTRSNFELIPVIGLQNSSLGYTGVSFEEFFDMATGLSLANDLSPTLSKTTRLVIAIGLYLIALLLTTIDTDTARVGVEQFTAIASNPRVILASRALFNLLVQVGANPTVAQMRLIIDALRLLVGAMLPLLGPALLAVLRTLRWWQYVRTAAVSMAALGRVLAAIAASVAFVAELIRIALDPPSRGAFLQGHARRSLMTQPSTS